MDLDVDVVKPAEDSHALSQLLQMYSLIKDKGGLSGTQFTDIFDYNNSLFNAFDAFVKEEFSSPYTAVGGQAMKGLYTKVAKAPSQSFMGRNRAFIPYINNITENDVIASQTTEVQPDAAITELPVFTGVGDVRITYTKTRKSKVYIDDEVKKALSYRVNDKMLRTLATNIGQKFNVKVTVAGVDEIAARFGPTYAQLKGFVQGGEVVINSDLASIDTPLHEFSHLWFEALAGSDRGLYDSLVGESLSHPYAETIRARYPELDDNGVANDRVAQCSAGILIIEY